MSIEELKQLQLQIIEKNKKCHRIGISITLLLAFGLLGLFLLLGLELRFIIMVIVFQVFFCIIVTVIAGNIVNAKDIAVFYREFKNIFVLKALRNHFSDIVYQEDGFDEDYVREIGMIDTGDRYSSNDYICGTYKSIKFEQSDIHIEEKHIEEDEDGNKKEEWETIFRGRLMVFDFNKQFKADIQLISGGFRANVLPWNKDFSTVKMEDMEFNKMFRVYAESEHEAFYILTPHFMQRIKDITKKLNYRIMFGFTNSKLHIAINNNQDSFECNVFKEINEEQVEKDIIKDIKVITDFVDELNLDNDLFRREV